MGPQGSGVRHRPSPPIRQVISRFRPTSLKRPALKIYLRPQQPKPPSPLLDLCFSPLGGPSELSPLGNPRSLGPRGCRAPSPSVGVPGSPPVRVPADYVPDLADPEPKVCKARRSEPDRPGEGFFRVRPGWDGLVVIERSKSGKGQLRGGFFWELCFKTSFFFFFSGCINMFLKEHELHDCLVKSFTASACVLRQPSEANPFSSSQNILVAGNRALDRPALKIHACRIFCRRGVFALFDGTFKMTKVA